MRQYSGESGIISITSWKARINTVGLTLFSLIKQCPQFHIVLVLSEEEFPNKEAELPKDLQMMVSMNYIEILWVFKNVKCFKKILYTMDKYKTAPIISADDDCIYMCNYADRLYQKWLQHKDSAISYCVYKPRWYQHGPATLYPPNSINEYALSKLNDAIIATAHDDVFYGICLHNLNIPLIEIDPSVPYIFHDTIHPLSGEFTISVEAAKRIIDANL